MEVQIEERATASFSSQKTRFHRLPNPGESFALMEAWLRPCFLPAKAPTFAGLGAQLRPPPRTQARGCSSR